MQKTWLKHYRWLLGGLLLTCLALAAILIIWAIGAHQYQLALADYVATHAKMISIPRPQGGGTLVVSNPSYQPPLNTSGPDAWGWAGWTTRLLAICLPISFGLVLHWREHRQQFVRIHKKHIDHATNRLAEAIGINQELPEGVFDAYSKLRELDKRPPLA